MELTYPGQNFNGSYLSNRIAAPTNLSQALTDPAMREQAANAAQQVFDTKYQEHANEGLAERLGKYVLAGGVDTIDTVASILPNVQRGDIWQSAANMGMKGLADWQERNKSGVEMTSGIITSIAGAYMAERYIIGGLADSLLNSTALQSMRVVRAGQGIMANARATALATQLAAAENGTTVSLFASGMRSLLATQVGKNVAHAAVTEGTILALGHNNDAIWSNDMASNYFYLGLGLTLPAAAGVIQARATKRIMASDPTILKARVKAMDPKGYKQQRDIQANPSLPFNPDLELDPFAVVTQSAMEWRQKIDVNNPSSQLRDNRSVQEVQMEEKFRVDLNKALVIGDEDSGGKMRRINTNSSHPDNGMYKHVISAVAIDPTLLIEATTVGTGIPREIKAGRTNQINTLATSTLPEDLAHARELRKEIPTLLIENRIFPSSQEGDQFFEFEPKQVAIKNQGIDYLVTYPTHSPMKLNIGSSVDTFTKMPIQQRMSVITAFRDIISRNKRIANPNSFAILDDSSMFQHAKAVYMLEKNATVDLAQSSYRNADDVRFGTIKASIKAMRDDGVWRRKPYLGQWDRLKYNLPAASSLERIEDGSSKAIYEVLQHVDNGNITSCSDARDLYNQLLSRNELASDVRTQTRQFTGDIFNFNRNQQGDWYNPVFMWQKPKTSNVFVRGTRQQLAESMAQQKQKVFQELMPPVSQFDVVTEVNAGIHLTPEGQNLQNVSKMANDQVTGTGSEPSAEIGALQQTSARARNSVDVKSALRTTQRTEDLAMEVTKGHIAELEKLPNLIKSSTNRAENVLFDRAWSFRPGWDLESGFQTGADGYHRFVLRTDSALNEERLGRKAVPGEFLKDSNGNDIVLGNMGRELWERFTDKGWTDAQGVSHVSITEQHRLAMNKVRRASGLSEIRHAPHYIPSIDTKGKYLGWVIDSSTGKVIQGKAVVAATAEEFTRMRKQMEASISSQPNLYFHSQSEIESAIDVWDQAQMHFISPAFTGRLNTPQTGRLVGENIRQNTVDDMLRYILDSNMHLGRQTMRVALQDQIQIAKMHREVDRQALGATQDTKLTPHTIWDDWLKAVAGPESADVNPRRITTALTGLDDIIQTGITAVWSGLNKLPTAQAGNLLHDVFQRFGLQLPSKTKDFDALTTALGPHMPYQTLGDWVEQTRNAKRPPTVREIASKMNRLDASIRLRYLEIPNAAMNMLGIIDNMQAIVGNVPTLGQLVNGTGRKVGVLDKIGIIMHGTKAFWNPKKYYAADWEYAKKHGGLKQGIAEVREIMSAVDNPTGWAKAFYGDKTIKNPSIRNPGAWIQHKGVDGMMAVMNDTTEDWSRQWAHAIGLKMADYQGIVGDAERFNFANSVADEAIANYSPLNRGEAYNTAFGSLMGLYQTYSMNYSTRMFRYLEGEHYSALTRQMAAQTLMFGTQSNLGWNAFSWLESKFNGRDEDSTVNDLIYAKFGPIVGSAVAHGGIADLAMLFGAPTGMALYQRADTNIRTSLTNMDQGFDPSRMAAALGTTRQIGTAIWELGKAMWSDDKLETGRHVSEILADQMPNRTLKGMLTLLFNDGTETDQYGNVTGTTQGVFESTLRGMGLRSTRQQDEVDWRYANSASLDKEAARMEQLREQTKASIRDGSFPEKAADIWQAYKDRGGNPAMFRSWTRQMNEAATTSRELRSLKNGLNSPQLQLNVARDGWTN